MFQFENANGKFKSYVRGTREVCAQIIKQSVISAELILEGDSVFKTEFAKSLFDSLVSNVHHYKTSIKCNGNITLAGPPQIYHLNASEVQKLSLLLGIKLAGLKAAPSYKHMFVHKLRFDVYKSDSLMVANYIIATSKGLYILEKCLNINNEAVCLGKKLMIKQVYEDCTNIFKVISIALHNQIISPTDVTANKFFVILNKNKKIDYVFKILCVRESE